MSDRAEKAPQVSRGSSYALQQLVRAFSTNATSWIGLVTFLVVVALARWAQVIKDNRITLE